MIWTTRDNAEIPIEQMQESHIINCMKLLGKQHRLYNYFLYELAYRHNDIETMLNIDPHIGSVIEIKHNDGAEYWDEYWERNTY